MPKPLPPTLALGLREVRAGEDYVNNGHRYEHAVAHLAEAYDALAREAGAQGTPDHLLLAKVCLWKGIALNENLDVRDPVARNDPAIAEYQRGLAHLRRARPAPGPDDATKMSLWNSLGVALHHRAGGGTDPRRRAPPAPIPAKSFYYYRKARAAFNGASANPAFAQLMAKIESNSGRGVLRGGGGGGGASQNVVVM